jgi:hypothetical protein
VEVQENIERITRKSVARSRDDVLNVEQVASLLMISAAWVRHLTRNGWIAKVDGGKGYRVADVVQGYIKFMRDEARRASKSEAQRKVHEARAREIELRTAVREKSLIEIDDALGALDGIIGVVLTELSEMPARTRDLKARQIIEASVRDVRQRIADKAKAKVAELSG